MTETVVDNQFPRSIESVVPAPSDVEQLSNSLRDDSSLAPESKKAAVDTPQVVLDQLTHIEQEQRRHAALAKASSEAAEATKQAKNALEKTEPKPAIQNPAWQPMEQVRGLQAQAETELNAAREARAALESRIRDREVRRAALESIILATRASLDQLESQPAYEPVEGEDPRISKIKRWKQAIDLALARAKLRTQKQEQLTYAAESELLPAQLEWAKRDALRKEFLSQEWAKAVADRRDTKVTQQLAEFRGKYGATRDDNETEILDYEAVWLEIVRDSAVLQQTQAKVTSEVTRFHNDYTDRKVEVENDLRTRDGLRSSLGLKLQRLRSRLPDLRDLRQQISEVQVKIDSAQVIQSEIEERIEELSGGSLLRQNPSYEMEPAALAESQLLRQMRTDVSEYWNELLELKTLHENLHATVRDFGILIDRNVLWIRSDRRFQLADVPIAWQAFQELLHDNTGRTSGHH